MRFLLGSVGGYDDGVLQVKILGPLGESVLGQF